MQRRTTAPGWFGEAAPEKVLPPWAPWGLGGRSVPALLPVTLPDPISTQDCGHHPCPRDFTASASPRLSPPQHGCAQALDNASTGNSPTSQTMAPHAPSQASPLCPAQLLKAPSAVPALDPLETPVHRLPSSPSLAFSPTLKSSILPTPQLPRPLPVPCSCPACPEL